MSDDDPFPRPSRRLALPSGGSGRADPQNEEAEEYLLSAILLSGAETLGKTLGMGIEANCFYSPANQLIYAQCVDLMGKGQPVEMATLGMRLTEMNQLDQVGGYANLMKISGRVSTTAKVEIFAKKVHDAYVLRQAIRHASAVVEAAHEAAGESPADVVGPHVSRLMNALSGSERHQALQWDKIVEEAEAVATQICERQGLPADMIIKWPWRCMDLVFQPMQRGQLVVLAARPSVGKSSLARPMALAAAKAGHHVAFFTLEVSRVRLPLQMAATLARVGITELGRVHNGDKVAFMEALKSLRGLPISVFEHDRSIAQIMGRVAALHASKPVDMVIIDHGGQVSDISRANQKEKIGLIGQLTKGLKAFAHDNKAVCVLLWQLNRGSVNDGNREPRAADLRDSGELEQDADKVILIHRPDNDPSGGKQPYTASVAEVPAFFQNVIQDKGRDDGTATLSFRFQRTIATFVPEEGRSP